MVALLVPCFKYIQYRITSGIFSTCLISKKDYPMKRIPKLFTSLHKQIISISFLAAFVFATFGLTAQIANYQLDKLGDNLFQVSIIPNVTYTGANKTVSTMQAVVKVRTGGFQAININSLVAGFPFVNSSITETPLESPQHDYLSFSLPVGHFPTELPTFNAGEPIPLFTFQNGGICTQDSLSLILPSDPFYPNPTNSINSNADQQLSIVGFGGPDAPVGVSGPAMIADCLDNCVAEYSLTKMANGAFQVTMTPRETYNGTGNNNQISNLQVTIRIKSDGFVAGNIINQITGVVFDTTSRENAPIENANFDYISFNLTSGTTNTIPFVAGTPIDLFTFNNVGFCTEDTVTLMTVDDPFSFPNSRSANVDQQLTILGYGMSDAPVCIGGVGAEDCIKDCVLGCNDNVQVSLGIGCTAEVRPEMVATALTLTCPNGPKGVEILENGFVIPTSPFLNESHIGRTFQVRVIDSITTNSCWGSIVVKDKTPPIIACSDIVLNCAIQDISPNNPVLGYPTVTDNCSDTVANLTYSDRIIRNGCGALYNGRIERTWRAVDSAGMEGICVQNIDFRRQPMTAIAFPPNRDGITGPIVDCTDGATDPANTGAPTLAGDVLYPNAIGFCQINAVFNDTRVEQCEGNIQIIRRWTVVDACNGLDTSMHQIISVRDTTPPVLTCPDTIPAIVDAGTCSSTVTFPAAVVSDACSGARVIIETSFGNIYGNGGTLPWIPVGYHPVTYTAIDSCDNRISCTTVLHVADRTAPVAACDFINDVSLRPNGTVVVNASVFDDGSRDGCSGFQLDLKVQKVGDTLDFADFVTFYCTDAGDTVDVNMRVTDLSGNVDECVARIVITNDTPPSITCPANQTIQCTDDYSDLNIFGTPTILDDCGGTTNYTERDSFEINGCGVGRIIRTFTVNHGGTPITCEQIINIENNSVFNGNTITWPSNYQAFACNNVSTHPDDLPEGFNVPRYDSIGNLCSRILRSHSDAIFDDVTDPAGCYIILRTWSIIDACVFNPNDTLAGGYWEYVQQIELMNTTPPTISGCPTDVSISVTDNSCAATIPLMITASDDCTPDSLLTYSYTVDLNNDGTTDLTGTTNDASGTYQVGIHRVRFLVNDNCGNTAACNFLLTVSDGSLPRVVCPLTPDTFNIQDIAGELIAIVDARQLAAGSSDDCTAFDDLIITATPATFGCSQEGENQVTVVVEDEAGNKDSCLVTVFIADRDKRCPVNRTAVSIKGIITNEIGERVEQVAVTINHPDVLPAMTNTMGEFKLKDVPVGNDYTILPTRDFDLLNGISTFDLVLISRHILNIELIKSPYRLIAADVNRSGGITAYDMIQLRKIILRMDTEFPNNTSWRFVRTDFDFKNPTEPNRDYFPEVYNINDLPRNDMEIEGFVAVKVGDVNASANTQSDFVEGEDRNATDKLKLTTSKQLLVAGNIVEIPVNAANFEQLLGFQFALNFDPAKLEFLELLPNENAAVTANNFGMNFIDRGIITTSWEQPSLSREQANDTNIFSLKFKVKETTDLSRALRLDYQFMKAEAYANNGNENLELLDVSWLIEEDVENTDFILYQNRPNPFSANAIISFDLGEEEKVALSILDITGRVVKQFKYDAVKGYNELTINRKELGGKGVYYYQLATSSGMKTKKMIVVD